MVREDDVFFFPTPPPSSPLLPLIPSPALFTARHETLAVGGGEQQPRLAIWHPWAPLTQVAGTIHTEDLRWVCGNLSY